MIVKRAAISHSKHRNMFGLVGIEADSEKKEIHVKLARQWSRDKLNTIPLEIKKIHNKIMWDTTYTDQLVGEHFIQALRRDHNLRIQVINTQKNLKDPDDIEKVKTMDKVEMVQWMLTIFQDHQIKFPEKRSRHMEELTSQIAIFTEHKTEAGNIDYFAPGEEYDNLVKALMITCFSVRNMISKNVSIEHVGGGIPHKPDTLAMSNPDYKTDSDVIEALTRKW